MLTDTFTLMIHICCISIISFHEHYCAKKQKKILHLMGFIFHLLTDKFLLFVHGLLRFSLPKKKKSYLLFHRKKETINYALKMCFKASIVLHIRKFSQRRVHIIMEQLVKGEYWILREVFLAILGEMHLKEKSKIDSSIKRQRSLPN